MKKMCVLMLDTQEVVYTLSKRRGQRNIRLTVKRDGTITLSTPWWVSAKMAERYLVSKRKWLEEVLAKVSPSPLQGEGRGGVGGGRLHAQNKNAHYKKHKEAARTLIEARLVDLNCRYGFTWGRVAIRKNSTSWGSCSSKRNLNFDYRILFLPSHLQDYIIVHELCHLREMNHSPRFWALVAEMVPAYKVCRRELRTVRKQ